MTLLSRYGEAFLASVADAEMRKPGLALMTPEQIALQARAKKRVQAARTRVKGENHDHETPQMSHATMPEVISRIEKIMGIVRDVIFPFGAGNQRIEQEASADHCQARARFAKSSSCVFLGELDTTNPALDAYIRSAMPAAAIRGGNCDQFTFATMLVANHLLPPGSLIIQCVIEKWHHTFPICCPMNLKGAFMDAIRKMPEPNETLGCRPYSKQHLHRAEWDSKIILRSLVMEHASDIVVMDSWLIDAKPIGLGSYPLYIDLLKSGGNIRIDGWFISDGRDWLFPNLRKAMVISGKLAIPDRYYPAYLAPSDLIDDHYKSESPFLQYDGIHPFINIVK